jgi:NAD(P)-dependent dehydrogenase (short-subunit alcohol dehydrogenase family)
MSRLAGKTAVITGGASGIGEATVRLFAAEGANVVLADIDPQGKAIADELGSQVVFASCDVSQEEQVAAAVATAVSTWGRLDVMFNNAGFGGVSGPIDELDMSAYDVAMSVLLRGVFSGVKHAAKVMKAQRSGSIINTASVAGIGAIFGPHTYSAAKAAVVQISKTTAVELGEFGVRVNAVCPGGIATPIFGKSLDLDADELQGSIEVMKLVLANSQPMNRAGLPIDIAEAVLWLASDSSTFVSGHALVVDGAITLRPGGLFGQRDGSTPEERRDAMRAVLRGVAAPGPDGL